MADRRRALFSVGVACLGFVCFVLGAVAVGLPTWGYFYNPEQALYDQGYFGPWRVCKVLLYNREKCGVDVARFRPSVAVYWAGVVGAIGVAALSALCVLSVLQLAMLSSKEQVVMKYTHLVTLKLALALLATLLSVAAAGLFAVQIDDRETRGFVVRRGEAFYIQIVCIVLNALLGVAALYDALGARRAGGDPTAAADLHDTTITNPGFKDSRPGVAVTDASGKPYGRNGHGSVASVSTAATSLTGLSSDGSTITRSPLRSSLKKPRAAGAGGGAGGAGGAAGAAGGALGIHNPGYSGSSPPLGRNGSQKKVRIQTHSTEV